MMRNPYSYFFPHIMLDGMRNPDSYISLRGVLDGMTATGNVYMTPTWSREPRGSSINKSLMQTFGSARNHSLKPLGLYPIHLHYLKIR